MYESIVLRTTSLFTQKLKMVPLCGLNSKVLSNETNALKRAPFNQTPRAERQTTWFCSKKPLYRASLHVAIAGKQHNIGKQHVQEEESYTCCHFQTTLCHIA